MFRKKFLSLLLFGFFVFSFYPFSVNADYANCSIDSFYVTSGLSVEATWSMYSTTGGSYYDIYMSWDGGAQFLVGKQDGDPSFADSGIVGTTFSSSGWHTVSINVGGVHCSDTASINIPDPVQLGTICADANIGTQVTISGPGGTFVGNPSVCADTVVGTYNVTGASVANYNGPSYSNGQSLTIPAWGAVSTFLTYSPYLYRCSGASCIRDDSGGNTSSSNCNNSCVAPVNGSCGTANAKTYASGVSAYSPDTQCSSGSSSNTAFPSAGGSVSWTCSGSNGGSSSGTCSASRSAAVSVPVVTISASPTSVTSGGSSTLTWSSTNSPTSCTASNGWSGAKATSGSESTGAITTSQTYTLSCTNAGGTGVGSVTVTVSGTPVNGACGTANKTYSSGSTTFGSDTFCSTGTASPPSPAFPSEGSSTNWSCLGSGGGTNASCTATRTAGGYSITVTPATGGTVVAVGNSINCGSTCSSSYAQGTSVTLQAYPASSYWKFNGWSGDCVGSGLCILVVNGAKSVVPSFVLRSFNYNEF